MNKDIKEYRFTLFTNDAKKVYTEINMDNLTDVKKLKSCTWNLNFGQYAQGRTRLAIESIFCRDSKVIIDDDHLKNFAIPVEGMEAFEYLQLVNLFDKTARREIYSIRCPQVNSMYVYDKRVQPQFQTAPIIYMGPLELQNQNPKEVYNYECNKDILNSTFTLYFDDNFTIIKDVDDHTQDIHGEGINPNLHIGITFILYDIRDE